MLHLTEARGFTQKDLLTAIIRDPIIVSPEMSTREAIARMSEGRSLNEAHVTAQASNPLQIEARASCVIVVESQKVVGILTERDVVRLCAAHPPSTETRLDDLLWGETPVRQVMTASVLTLREAAFTDLFAVVNLLQQNHLRHLLIVDEQDGLVGLVTYETLQQVLQPTDLLHLLLLRIKNDLLDRVATQESLTDTLNYVCTTVEGILDGAICSVLLLDSNNQLRDGAAPSLPDHYRHQVDGIQAGEGVGSCGTAVHRRKRVIVADIANDPLWKEAKNIPLTSGLKACWSTPIVMVDGAVLGTFAVYYREVRSPRTDEIALVDGLVHIVMLAIQRHQNDIALKQTNLRLQEAQRIAQLGHWELNLQHNTLYWCKEVFRLFELDPQQCHPSYETFWEFVHPDDRETFNEALSKHLRDRQPYSIVHRLQMPDGRIKYVRGQCETISSADGTSPILQGTVQNITQQQEAEMHREQAEASLRQVIEGTAAFTGEEFFPALVRHIGEALGVRCVSVGKATPEGLHILALCADSELCLPQFLPYDLVPCCYQTLQNGSCCHPAGLQTLYPGNPVFISLQAESYLGVRLCNAAGEPTGSLCIFHDAPLADPDWAETLVSIFAARAGAELERLLTSQALEQLNAELEERVTQRTTMLAEREARYRGLLEGAADAILLTDLQGNILEANQRAEALFGYPLADLTTRHFTQLHPPEVLPRSRQAFTEIAQKQRTQILDEIFLRPDGTTVSVDVTATVIELNGETLVQGIFRDISERKAIEQALQESQQFLQTVLDTVPLSVFWKDRSSNYLGANERFLHDAALSSPSELVGKNDFDMFWGPTEAEAYRADDRTVMESGEAKLGIIETLHQQDGTVIWLETNKLPLRNLAGAVIGVLGTYQDITSRRNADAVLQRQLVAIEAAIDGIAILLDERFVYLNSSHVELFGYQSTKELLGQSWRVLYSPEELERFDQEIWPALHERLSWQGEVTATRKDGTSFPEQISLTLSANNLLICVCQDISDRKQEQAALQQKTAELDRFFSVALDLLCIANLEGHFIRLNHQWEKVLGYSLSDLEGSQFMDFVHPEDMEATLQAMKTLEQGEDITGFTNRYRCRNGSYRWIEWRSAPSGGLIYAAARDITDRKQAETDLQNLTNRLTLALQAGAYGIWEWDLVDNAIWDKRVYEIYGLPDLDRAVTYQEWRSLIHADDIDCLEAQFEMSLHDRTPFNMDVRFWRTDGELRWVQIISKAEYDAEGNLVRVAGINCDITDRKAAEMLIRQQIERETLLREMTQMILQRSLNLDEILATVTQQVKEVLKGDRVIVFRLYPDGKSEIVEEAVSEGLPRLREKHWDDEVWSQDILDHYWQGQPRIVLDVMGDRWTECLIEYSIEGHIQSKIVAPILQEIQFYENHRWVSPYTNHKLWGVLVIHACTEKRVWLETEAQLLQQTAYQVAIAIQQINLFEQLQQELAERQQTQKQLTESNGQLAITNQELARATRLKDEFLANMSHELRTPLNAILGMSEVIQEEIFGVLSPKQKQYIEIIQSSGQHLLNLINDILDVAKIASGQITLEYSHVAIEQLCSSSLAFIAQQALHKQIQLETHIQPHLPDIAIDEIRIRQALLNLLTNAVKFTPAGGTVTLTVSLLCQEQDPLQPTCLRITITDTGIGIAPENIPKLFKPFVQIDGALNRQQTGTGLGLALVKQIVELHGGQVELTSKPGEGSCFTIDLPYTSQIAPAFSVENVSVARESILTPRASDLTSTQAPLILLAEDNLTNVATFSSYLEASGYRLLIANDGQEAIDLAILHHPNVILMDVQMPGVDGLEAMRQIRQHPGLSGIPIIALTALAMKGDEERCLAAGADYYLSKPVKLRHLNNLIQELLSS